MDNRRQIAGRPARAARAARSFAPDPAPRRRRSGSLSRGGEAPAARGWLSLPGADVIRQSRGTVRTTWCTATALWQLLCPSAPQDERTVRECVHQRAPRPPSRPVRPQIVQLCAAVSDDKRALTTVHIGGSARGYQELSAPLAITATAGQAGSQAACLCIARAGRERPLLAPLRVRCSPVSQG